MTNKYELTLLILTASSTELSTLVDRWDNSIDIGNLDDELYRCIPLILKKLETATIQSKWHDRLQSVYRHTWTQNNIRLSAIKSFIQEITSEVESLILLDDYAIALNCNVNTPIYELRHLYLYVDVHEKHIMQQLCKTKGLVQHSDKTWTFIDGVFIFLTTALACGIQHDVNLKIEKIHILESTCQFYRIIARGKLKIIDIINLLLLLDNGKIDWSKLEQMASQSSKKMYITHNISLFLNFHNESNLRTIHTKLSLRVYTFDRIRYYLEERNERVLYRVFQKILTRMKKFWR